MLHNYIKKINKVKFIKDLESKIWILLELGTSAQ